MHSKFLLLEGQPIGLAIALLIAGALSPSAVAAGKKTPEPTPWSVGTAAIDITPEGPVWLAGYGARKKPSEGIAQRLFAKALALDDRAGGQLVIVTLDLIGVPNPVRASVEQAVAERHGLAAASLLLNASHTHSGPSPHAYGVPDPEFARRSDDYGRTVAGKIIEVIDTALARRAPARLHYTHARAGFAMNRRLPRGDDIQNSPNPDGPVDHDVPVLRVTGADGKIKALLFGYACHNTVTGFYRINGDYAGYAQAFLEETRPGTTAMFMMGAAGDQNPYPRHASLDQTVQHGRTLAYAVEAALSVVAPRPVRGPLRCAYGTAELPYAHATREELVRRAQSNRQVEKLQAEALLRQLDSGQKLPTSYPCPVQVVSFGPDLTLVAVGGEITVDYSLRLKRELATPQRAVWVAGYSNAYFGYLGSRRVVLEGGYEGRTANLGRHPAPWAPEVEEAVVGRVHALLKSLGD